MEIKQKRNEVLLILLALLPLAYFTLIWKSLPDPVPVQYSINMEVNRYQSKISLFIGMIIFNTAFYLLFKYIDRIDPKKMINKQSKIYIILRFITGILISALGILLLLMAQHHESVSSGNKVMMFFLGALFAVLGNYLPIIKQNYFIGIRTPWTIDNEVVWTKTHRIGGKLFLIGGLLIITACFFSDPRVSVVLMISVAIGITVFSFAYSYLQFRKEKQKHA